MKLIHQGQDFFVTKRIVSLVKRLVLVSNIVLKGRGCHITLNTRAPTVDRSADSKDSFYEELEQVFHHSPKYHILLVLFNAKLGKEYILKPTTGNESLHEDSNDNGVRVVNSTI